MSLLPPVWSDEPTGPVAVVRPDPPARRRRPLLRGSARLIALLVLTAAGVGTLAFGPRALPSQTRVDRVTVFNVNPPPDPGLTLPPITVLPKDIVAQRPALPGEPIPPTLHRISRPQEQLRAWAEPLSDRLNIPLTALEAYGFAAAQLAEERPTCHLSWTMLAGVGKEESNHGRFGDSVLDAEGHTTVPIRGPALDGSDGVQRVPDTDHGRLDGDPTWDRAMGPFQFIPETWRRRGRDADGNGVADPDNISDAALTAGTYLCDAGGDLATPAGWWRALLVYNASHPYGQDVLDNAYRYALFSRDR